ncbi:hypothetical protein CC78DRAFT_605510 [Lojkania enalia]|uniref:Uncharacterized protein n=1 Tax=Lojkania enalia TaxID=147567 RepID=A0A9P4TPN5_9PLEO|nr:hypothetical protein CC78DRAFT_605510 [Didymosphaeria enalia]
MRTIAAYTLLLSAFASIPLQTNAAPCTKAECSDARIRDIVPRLALPAFFRIPTAPKPVIPVNPIPRPIIPNPRPQNPHPNPHPNPRPNEDAPRPEEPNGNPVPNEPHPQNPSHQTPETPSSQNLGDGAVSLCRRGYICSPKTQEELDKIDAEDVSHYGSDDLANESLKKGRKSEVIYEDMIKDTQYGKAKPVEESHGKYEAILEQKPVKGELSNAWSDEFLKKFEDMKYNPDGDWNEITIKTTADGATRLKTFSNAERKTVIVDHSYSIGDKTPAADKLRSSDMIMSSWKQTTREFNKHKRTRDKINQSELKYIVRRRISKGMEEGGKTHEVLEAVLKKSNKKDPDPDHIATFRRDQPSEFHTIMGTAHADRINKMLGDFHKDLKDLRIEAFHISRRLNDGDQFDMVIELGRKAE